MSQLLVEHMGRTTQILSGPWRFQIDQDDQGENEAWFAEGFDRSEWATVNVPGAWDLYEQSLWSYEGIGWYATQISPQWVKLGSWQRLCFSSVNIQAKVWLNGHYLGEHVGGYLPFEVGVSPYLRSDGPNHLVVRVDNVPRLEWLPGAKVIEWMMYGGILEQVVLATTAPTHIDDLLILATPSRSGADVTCKVEITNHSADGFEGRVSVHVPDIDTDGKSVPVQCEPNASAVVSVTLQMPEASRWSPDSPTLYPLSVELVADGEIIDSVGDRFGVRSIEVRGAQILLNGEPLQIKGVCRYDEYAPYGATVPEEVLREDLLRIKQAGANLVRVHYPQDSALLNLMDEIGLLLMEEACLCWWAVDWWGSVADDHHHAVIDAAEKSLEGMIRRDKNHPCVIIWSMANECGTDTKVGIQAMRRMMRRARELDPSRLVTFVVAHDPKGHAAVQEADFVAVNSYQGLFRGEVARHIADMDRVVRAPTAALLQRVRDRFPDKPVAVTEFGVHGIRGLKGDARFTEDHQAAYIQAAWRAITETPGMSGGVLWCWADYFHRRDFFGRGDSTMLQAPYGPYGVVTVDRKPKKALRALAQMFGAVIKG